MSLLTTFTNAIVAAAAANPAGIAAAVSGATSTFQSQVSASVQPASAAVTAAQKLLPQLQMAVNLGNVAAIQTIAGQIVAIPSQTNDIKNAALMLSMFAGDPKVSAYFAMLSGTIAQDVTTQSQIGQALGVNITPIF